MEAKRRAFGQNIVNQQVPKKVQRAPTEKHPASPDHSVPSKKKRGDTPVDQENVVDLLCKPSANKKDQVAECHPPQVVLTVVPELRDVVNTRSRSSSLVLKSIESPKTEEIVPATHIDFTDPSTYYIAPKGIPAYVEDFDRSQLHELASEPHYAHDVFAYYKKQEVALKVVKYLTKQSDVTKAMRAVLVDWMVEVQESFELNHETLYLAVKLVDHFLMTKNITKNKFQLLGATCILIAAKFDERIPPAIEDFLYICDDAYQRRDIILMEIEVLRKLNFFIGYPISYRFLRRYARCAKLSMETLTLARYILEMSLMDYDVIEERDSLMAAAALMLALKMKKSPSWTTTLEFYSGYEEQDVLPLMYKLNSHISLPPKAAVKTIRTKYSHRIFFEVAKISPLPKV